MKTTWLNRRIPVILALGLLFLGAFVSGCSDDEDAGGGVGPGSEEIAVTDIIFNPKALAPGDTLTATAVVYSASQNVGDFVTYEWTKTGGDWVDPVSSDQSSIRWRAPADRPGIYGFSVTARNSVSQSTMISRVFVGVLNNFIAARAGQLYTRPSSADVYYTSAPGLPTGGLILRSKDAAGDQALFSTVARRSRFTFNTARTRETHQFTDIVSIATKTVVVYDDLSSMQRTVIAQDDGPIGLRLDEYTNPYISPDGNWVAYQAGLLDTITPAQGGVDTFAVYVHDLNSGIAKRATFRGAPDKVHISTNYYPTISSDNSMVVFIADRKGAGIWEYYGLPIQGSGVVADTVTNALVTLSDTQGNITDGSPLPNAVALRQWCPDPANPTLASVGKDKKLRFIGTDGSGARVIDVPGDVVDISWAPGGAFLVASASDEGVGSIYRIPAAGGAAQVLWTGLAGDRMENLSVSNDGVLLVYTNKRSTNTWYEIITTTRSPDDEEPVRITPSWSPGEAATFGAPLQSLRPAWAPTGTMVYLIFTDESTPRVMSLDLTGIGE